MTLPKYVAVWNSGHKRFCVPCAGEFNPPLDAKNVETFSIDTEPDHGVFCCEQLSGPDGIHVTIIKLPFGDSSKAKAYYRADRDVTGFKTISAELGGVCGACGCTTFYNKALEKSECRGCGVR